MHYLAKSLSGLGLRVSHIVFEHDGLPTHRNGVDLVHAPAPSSDRGRASYARGLIAALREADAAVYVSRNAGPEVLLAALHVAVRRRKLIHSISWDGDLTHPPISRWLSRAGFRLGVRLADVVVAQTEAQLRGAREVVHGPVELIRSFAESVPEAGVERTAFLWIGRIVDYKDPLAYLELARRVPDGRFWMVADTSGNEDEQLIDELRGAAAETSNLELLPPRPRELLFELYDRAIAVVNTSRVEGFPNTFMEGWARGVPALSLRLDPDQIIRRHRLGTCAGGSLEELARATRELWAGRGDRAVSERAREYISQHHSPTTIGAQWQRLISKLRATS